MSIASPDFGQAKPATQARSRATLDRLLSATSRVLQEKTFEQATLAEIAGAAGLTTGAIYKRFAGKAALRDYLEAAVREKILAASDRAGKRAGPALRDYVGAVVQEVLELYGAEGGAVRTLVVSARSDEDLRSRLNVTNAEVLRRFVDEVMTRAAPANPALTRHAAEFVFVMMTSTLREAVLFAEVWSCEGPRAHATLAARLEDAACKYLETACD